MPPRETDSVPIHEGANVCVSPDEVMVRPMFASVDVAKVCVAPVCEFEYCALMPVRPSPAPASPPQANWPVVAFHNNLSPEPEHDASPAPVSDPDR